MSSNANGGGNGGGSLTVYQRMSDPLEAVKTLGTAIAKSGMFGCGSIEQGQVFALECLARGMPPLTLAERFHVVQGKLMMKYDAMLAEFHALGGKHKIVSRTEDKAEIELTIDGETYNESLTWEQAQKEKWPFKADGKSLKDNWATPKARRQMLWARVVSEGVRALRPGVNNGRYVAEEIESDDEPATVATTTGNGHAKQPSASVVGKAEAAAKQAAVDVPFETKPAATTQVEMCNASQRELIEHLFAGLGLTPAQREAALAKRNAANSIRNLTKELADDLITALENKLAAIKQAHEAKLPKVEPGNEPITVACGPCTPHQEQAIKAKLAEWNQIDKDACGAAMVNLKKKLHESGRKGIIELSANDAAKLYDAIMTRSLDGFFKRSLEEWRPKEEPSKFVESLAEGQNKPAPAIVAIDPAAA